MNMSSIFSLDHYLPVGIIKNHNPLFDLQLRKLRWPRGLNAEELTAANRARIGTAKVQALKRYTWLYGLIIPLVFAVIGAVILNRPTSMSYWFDFLIVYGPIGFGLLCSLFYSVTAVNRITHQATMEQWELLRLTQLTERDIVLANYATIQIQAWRLAIIEIGIRFGVVCMILLMIIFPYDSALTLNDHFWLNLAALLVMATGYTLEPLWRMRTVTLIGMTCATWLDGYATAIITSFAGLLGLVLLEAAVIIGGGVAFSRLFVYDDDYSHVLLEQLIAI